MTEDAPGHGEITRSETALAESFGLALLENSDACLGRSAAALQPGEAFLFKTLFQLVGIRRTGRVVDLLLSERAGALLTIKATISADRFDRRAEVQLVLPLQTFLQLAPFCRSCFLIQFPIEDQSLCALS